MAVEMIATLRSETQIAKNTDQNSIHTFISDSSPKEEFDRLLCDSDGVKLFTDFLCSHCSSGHLLDFWFACKGFRSKVDTLDKDKAFQVAKIIYHTYVKSGAEFAVPLSPSLKHEIVSSLTSYQRRDRHSTPTSPAIMRSLFDVAQETIKSILEVNFYPMFLEFLRNTKGEILNRLSLTEVYHPNPSLDCPSDEPISNSYCTSPRFDPAGLSSSSTAKGITNLSSQFSPPHMSDRCRSTPLTRKSRNLVMHRRNSSRLHADSNCSIEQTSAQATCFNVPNEAIAQKGTARHVSSTPAYTEHMPTPPTQCTTRASQTDRPCSNPPAFRHQSRADQSLAERDPVSFAKLLTSRLEQVKENRGIMDKLFTCVNHVEHNEARRSPAALPATQMASDLAGTSTAPASSVPGTSSSHERSSLTASMAMSNLFSQRHIFPDHEDDPQGILDDHCSRIWADERPKSMSRFSSKGVSDRQSTRRRRCSSRLGTNRLAGNSALRSPKSADSGVTGVPHPTSTPSDVESNSIVAAASLQALTSSLTDLAVMNNEVTSQLVEQMARKFQKAQADHGSMSNPPNVLARTDSQFPHLHGQTPVKPFPNQMNLLASFGYCSPNDNKCQPYALSVGFHSQYRYHPHQFPNEQFVQPSFKRASSVLTKPVMPLTSDSSPFDSGISSTYDHLPTHASMLQDKRDLESFPNWYAEKIRSPSHPPVRTRSSHGPCCRGSFCQRFPSPTTATTWINPAQTQPPMLTASGDVSHGIGTGRLLQHWLLWQSDDPLAVDQTGARQTTAIDKRRRSLRCPIRPNMVQSIGPMSPDQLAATGQRLMETTYSQLDMTASANFSSPSQHQPQPHSGLVVGYYLCDDPVPYRTVWVKPAAATAAKTDSDQRGDTHSLTLGQFKQLIAKKGVYRYFFKKPSDEFGSGAVHEEFTQDDSILPLWEGKVVARIERVE